MESCFIVGGEYLNRRSTMVTTDVFGWRGDKVVVNFYEASGLLDGGARILGKFVSVRETEDGDCYKYEPVPIKLQKNLRAHLRGTELFSHSNMGADRISFAK